MDSVSTLFRLSCAGDGGGGGRIYPASACSSSGRLPVPVVDVDSEESTSPTLSPCQPHPLRRRKAGSLLAVVSDQVGTDAAFGACSHSDVNILSGLSFDEDSSLTAQLAEEDVAEELYEISLNPELLCQCIRVIKLQLAGSDSPSRRAAFLRAEEALGVRRRVLASLWDDWCTQRTVCGQQQGSGSSSNGIGISTSSSRIQEFWHFE
jgi:hypothetical protein